VQDPGNIQIRLVSTTPPKYTIDAYCDQIPHILSHFLLPPWNNVDQQTNSKLPT